MKTQFESPRWLGRLTKVLIIQAQNKAIRFKSNPNILELLSAVLNKSNEEEKRIINELLKKFEDTSSFEKSKSITFPDIVFTQLRNKGISDADFIYYKYRNINNKILLEEDFALLYSQELEKARQLRKTRNKKILKIALSVIVAVAIGVCVYNLEYFREMRLYNEIVENQMPSTCHEYYSEFPEGKHYEEVMLIESNVGYYPINTITCYLDKFPNGKYVTVMNQKYDSLWNDKIETYRNLDKTSQSPEAIAFMTAMLEHMKDERITTVRLKLNPTINLKDYTEYDSKLRSLLEIMDSNDALPLTSSNVVSLKDNFTSADLDNLYSTLSYSIESSFERIFTSDFVNVVANNEVEASDKSPIILCNYTIENINESSSSELEIPNIWTYVSNNIPKAYILGIDVKFNLEMSIPGKSNKYSYAEVGNPGQEISNIEDIKDGYRKMTQACFNEFAQKMLINIGLNNQ